MAQDTSGAGTAAGGTTTVIPGEIAARIDRLPMSFMAWEICLIIQIGWSTSASTDGIAARLYPFIWLPAKVISHSQYDVLYALQAGISIVIGGYAIGWLSDKIGRRKALILSATLAGLFIWPFGYVTSYPALFILSIADTLGFAGFLAINVVYMSEIMGPKVRPRVMMVSQTLCIFLLFVVFSGIIPHYWFPGHYRWFLWMLTILNLLIAVALFFRMPESPRWLEARGLHDQARKAVEKMEARVMKRHPVLPEPDVSPYQVVAQEKTNMFAPFGKQYLLTTVFLFVVMVLGYAGIVYGGASQAFLFLAETRGYSAGFIFAITAWAGVAGTAVYVINALHRRTAGAEIHPVHRRHHLRRCLVGRLPGAQHRGAVRLLPAPGSRPGAVAVEHVHVHPRQLPDPDAVAGHRLDRRHRPPRRLGRRADRRRAVQRHLTRELDRVHHHPVRGASRHPGRGLRQAPARPGPRRTGQIAAGPPGSS